MSGPRQVRFAGFGGQGILTAGAVLGDAAVRAGLHAAGSSAYGSAARGGLCNADVVLADGPIDYPHVERPDLLVAMSQGALERFGGGLAPEGLLLADPAHVEVGAVERLVVVPATATALDELGRAQGANLIMLGALIALDPVVPPRHVEEAIREGTSARFVDANLRALSLGLSMGSDLRPAAAPRPGEDG